ncbi:MAG: hypothetical protein RBU23_06090 [Candidatus Auribacterota bacterium]|jgi:hypothetical protein|nr:hypothetical protein [Candidatus Auribacterota bacterium]
MQSAISILIDHRLKSTTIERVLYSLYNQRFYDCLLDAVIICDGDMDSVKTLCAKFSDHSLIKFSVINIPQSYDIFRVFNEALGYAPLASLIVYMSDKIILDQGFIESVYNISSDTFAYPFIISDPEMPIPIWVSDKTLRKLSLESECFAVKRKNMEYISQLDGTLIPAARAYRYITAEELSLSAILRRAYYTGTKRAGKESYRTVNVISEMNYVIYRIFQHFFLKRRGVTCVDLLQTYCERLGYLITLFSKRYKPI